MEDISLNQTANRSSPVALVTGSTSGIGAAIARRLSNEGYSVVLHSRHSTQTGQALAAELGNAMYIQADLLDDADRIKLVREAVSRWGRLDVLVNNAGISSVIPHADLMAASPAVWQEMHEINVVAPFRLVAEAEIALRDAARRGRPACVVNISSHAPDIRVNAVAPGLVDTPLTADWTAAQQLWRDRSPMRRPASPEDIAQIVMMLIASDYLTGEIVVADGGLSLT
jgi:NAD(P)-dependent dehydrogenase (short-subunit alcohol dehydrogenase family)